MLETSASSARRILLRAIPIGLLLCVVAILFLSLRIELGVKEVCAMATQTYPGDKVEALMKFVKLEDSVYSASRYSENNHVFWALGQLGDTRALPFLKTLLTGEPCDHETNLCQGEIREAIQKLEEHQFNLPAFLWRGMLKY